MISKFWPALALALSFGLAQAQTAPAKPAATKPAAAKAVKPAASAYPAVPAGAGYRFGPVPAWVKPLPPAGAPAAQPPAPGAKARREVLIDIQAQLAPKSATATWLHLQHVALDTSTLREVSEPQINFNPAYQQLLIHQVGVIREGRRLDRLKEVRIEMMRREQSLERQMIDGVRTALVVISDVRVGDVVDLAYTVEGENPIFEGRFAALLPLAGDVPIDRLHLRVEGPPERHLQVKGIASDLTPERFEEGGREVLRLVREHVAPILEESATPPWFKVYPALHISEYASWADVNQWAGRLFAPEPANAALAERIAALKAEGSTPEQQVNAALRFVQDEVRYFSASLGESSHRPKAPSRTLAERLGDCKDKVMLLNALLTGLGVDARPTLVSVQRNRGISNFLPSHDVFDHVISRVQIGEQVYFLDPTLNGQGLSLEKRGYLPYGAGLVVAAGTEAPVAIQPPAFAVDTMSYRQDWDLSDLKRPARLLTSFKASGLAAERWRAAAAQAGVDRIAEGIGGHYVKAVPGLVSVGSPELADDRVANEIESFHYRLKDGKVVIHEVINGGTTVLQPNESFTFAYFEYNEDFDKFITAATRNVREAQSGNGPFQPDSSENTIHFTTVPWVSFTSFAHARNWGREDSVPKIAFGKFAKENERTYLPISVEVHHALMDGVHVGRYLARFEEALAEPEGFLASK